MKSEQDTDRPVIHRLLDIIAKWPCEAQWFFLFFIIILGIGTLFGTLYALCILAHGWPLYWTMKGPS